MTDNKYPFIDGLRAISVYWVVSHHLFWFFDTQKIFEQIYGFFLVTFSVNLMQVLKFVEYWMKSAAKCGNIGVDMFFVISGFLITGLLLNDIKKRVSIKRFYIRRIFKIAPQYLLAVTFALVLYTCFPASINGVPPLKAYGTQPLGYIFFLQNYFVPIPLLAHTWSLVVEEQFYLIYPIIMWNLFSFYRSDERSFRRALIGLCLFVILFCNGIRYLYFFTGIPCLNHIVKSTHFFQTTFFRMDSLAMGCLLKLFENFISSSKEYWKYLTPFLFFLAALIFFMFICKKFSDGGYLHDKWYTYDLAYMASACAFVTGYRRFAPVKIFLENPVLGFLGRSSYGIYLWHYILIYPICMLVPYYGVIASTIIYIISLNLMGILTTVTFERYFLTLRAKVIP